jgi:Delta3,5-Delta2,4-dienoyl-CoA isomerase
VGFVTSIHENKAATIAAAVGMAAVMASKSPVAVQGTKELLNWSRDHSVQDGGYYPSLSPKYNDDMAFPSSLSLY